MIDFFPHNRLILILRTADRGICEIVERDGFMIHYLNKLKSQKVNIDKADNPGIKKIVNLLQRYKFEYYIINLTTDLCIPSIAAIIVDKTGEGPAVSVGLKAGFDINDLIISSIEEALMLRSWIRDKFFYLTPQYNSKKIIRDVYDRAYYWLKEDKLKYLGFWLNSKNLIEIRDLEYKSENKNKFEEIIKLIKAKKMDIIYIDISSKKFRKYGYKIVKVIIPQMQPLYLYYPQIDFTTTTGYEIMDE